MRIRLTITEAQAYTLRVALERFAGGYIAAGDQKHHCVCMIDALSRASAPCHAEVIDDGETR